MRTFDTLENVADNIYAHFTWIEFQMYNVGLLLTMQLLFFISSMAEQNNGLLLGYCESFIITTSHKWIRNFTIQYNKTLWCKIWAL